MSVNLSKGLVGHWPLDELHYNPATKRHSDLSAHCNHGTGATSAVFDADRMGSLGGACTFDGVSDCIASNIPKTAERTYSCWVNPSAFSSIRYLSCIGGDFGRFYINPRLTCAAWDTTYRYTQSIDDLVIGQYYHVVFTYKENDEIRLYLNDEFQDSTAIGVWAGSDAFMIGSRGTDRFFYGLVGDVRIYNRELNTQERTALYETYKPHFQLSSLQKDLVLDMPLTARWQ